MRREEGPRPLLLGVVLGWLSSLPSEASGVVRQVLGWEAALHLKKPSGAREGPLGRGHGTGGSGAPRELLR